MHKTVAPFQGFNQKFRSYTQGGASLCPGLCGPAGPALKGGGLADVSVGAESAALGRLTANWRSLTDMGPLLGPKGKST